MSLREAVGYQFTQDVARDPHSDTGAPCDEQTMARCFNYALRHNRDGSTAFSH